MIVKFEKRFTFLYWVCSNIILRRAVFIIGNVLHVRQKMPIKILHNADSTNCIFMQIYFQYLQLEKFLF